MAPPPRLPPSGLKASPQLGNSSLSSVNVGESAVFAERLTPHEQQGIACAIHNEYYCKTTTEWSDDFGLRGAIMQKICLPKNATPAVARLTHQTQLCPHLFLPNRATAYVRPAALPAFPTSQLLGVCKRVCLLPSARERHCRCPQPGWFLTARPCLLLAAIPVAGINDTLAAAGKRLHDMSETTNKLYLGGMHTRTQSTY